MACVPIPEVVPPTLPFPITIAPPETPDPGFDSALCCKLLQFAVVTPPIPLPPGTINPATVAAVSAIIKETLAIVTHYLDQIPQKCPRE